MIDNNGEIFYGVWIPNQGWLKGKDVFADISYEKAKQVARLIGRNARVRYIDISIIDLEHLYLQQESRSLWHTFRNWFHKNASKSTKSG